MIGHPYRVFYVKAESFSTDIPEAHRKLQALLPSLEGRSFYGISNRDSSGAIVYRAATKELYPGEADILGCDLFIIRKGIYLSQTLLNFPLQISMIKDIFSGLLSDDRIDENGYCLEIYLNDQELQCLVKLRDK